MGWNLHFHYSSKPRLNFYPAAYVSAVVKAATQHEGPGSARVPKERVKDYVEIAEISSLLDYAGFFAVVIMLSGLAT